MVVKSAKILFVHCITTHLNLPDQQTGVFIEVITLSDEQLNERTNSNSVFCFCNFWPKEFKKLVTLVLMLK